MVLHYHRPAMGDRADGGERRADDDHLGDVLRVVSSVLSGIAAGRPFAEIVDVAGDELRAMLGTENIGISWFERSTNLVHESYAYEHGVRLDVSPAPPSPAFLNLQRSRRPQNFGTTAEMQAFGFEIIAGTDDPKSIIRVPILIDGEVAGAILLEDYEREYAFGDSDERLLTTVAGSIGVALENARLFEETQRLLRETEQRTTELAAINSIQQGIAAQVDFAGIIDLVGDSLRESLGVENIGISWFDESSGLLHDMYAYERGVRLDVPPAPPVPGGTFERLRATRLPVVMNTIPVDEDTTHPGHGAGEIEDGRADHRPRHGDRVASTSRTSTTRMRTATPRSGCCRRSLRASVWRSRARCCSRRPNGCCVRPSSAPASWR